MSSNEGSIKPVQMTRHPKAFRCLHTQNMDVDKGSDQNLDMSAWVSFVDF